MTIITYGNLTDTNFIVVDTIEGRVTQFREINKIYHLNYPQSFLTGCGTGIVVQTIHQFFIADRSKNFNSNDNRNESIEYLNNFLLNSYDYMYNPMRTDLVICTNENIYEWNIDYDKASRNFTNLGFNVLNSGEIRINSFGQINNITLGNYNFVNIETEMWEIIRPLLQERFPTLILGNNYSYAKLHKLERSFYCKFFDEPPLPGSSLF